MTVFHNCGGERQGWGCIIANGVMILEPLMEDTPQHIGTKGAKLIVLPSQSPVFQSSTTANMHKPHPVQGENT